MPYKMLLYKIKKPYWDHPVTVSDAPPCCSFSVQNSEQNKQPKFIMLLNAASESQIYYYISLKCLIKHIRKVKSVMGTLLQLVCFCCCV